MQQCLWWRHRFSNLAISQKHKNLDISRMQHYFFFKGYFIAKNSFVAEVTFKYKMFLGLVWLTSNHMFDSNTLVIFENFEINFVLLGQSKTFQKCTQTIYPTSPSQTLLHKKWSFPLRISSVSVTKRTGNCGSGNIFWRHL